MRFFGSLQTVSVSVLNIFRIFHIFPQETVYIEATVHLRFSQFYFVVLVLLSDIS